MPTLSINQSDLDVIIDALKCSLTKSQMPRAERLVQQLTNPAPAPKGADWAPFRPPIRSAWPSGIVKSQRKPNPYFHKPREHKPAAPKVPLTADQILAGL